MDKELRGVLLTPIKDQPGAWEYRPKQPGIATTEDGNAQFTMIAAGSITMLSLTTIWGVPTKTLESVRADLATAGGCPSNKILLSPAAIDAGTAELQFGDGNGVFSTVSTAQSSGSPPFHAAFNLMLDQAQAEKVHKALSGERGWFGVRYTLVGQATPTREASATHEASIDIGVSLTDEGGSASAHGTGSASTYTATASETRDTGSGYSFADAADWGIPARGPVS